MKWSDLISEANLQASRLADQELSDVTNRKVIVRCNHKTAAPGLWTVDACDVLSDETTLNERRLFVMNPVKSEGGDVEVFGLLVPALLPEPLVSRSGFLMTGSRDYTSVLIVGDNLTHVTGSDPGIADDDRPLRRLKVRAFPLSGNVTVREYDARSVFLIVPLPSEQGYRKTIVNPPSGLIRPKLF